MEGVTTYLVFSPLFTISYHFPPLLMIFYSIFWDLTIVGLPKKPHKKGILAGFPAKMP
jgi:hypothetical protein